MEWASDTSKHVLLVKSPATATLEEHGLFTWTPNVTSALWASRTSTLVLDASVDKRPKDLLWCAALAGKVHDAGGHVLVARLPVLRTRPGDSSPPEQVDGCNAFAAHYGIEALRQLLAGAAPSDPWTRLEFLSNKGISKADKQAEVARLLEADSYFLASIQLGGAVAIDRLAGLVRNLGIKSVTIKARIDAVFGAVVNTHTNKPRCTSYQVADGRLCQVVEVAEERLIKPLCNFTAEIIDEVTVDDGINRTPTYTINAVCEGVALQQLSVPAAKYDRMEWTAQWGQRAQIEVGRGIREHVALAIKRLSKPTSSVLYRHSGWREIDARWVYLMPTGSVGVATVACKLDVSGYGLGVERQDIDPAAAYRFSLDTRHCAIEAVSLPLLAAAYTAPLRPVIPCAFTIVLTGETQIGKTGLAADVLRHYGDFSWHHTPMSASSTARAMERIKHQLADLLLLVDNAVPGTTSQQIRRSAEQLQEMFQAAGDGSSKKAMSRDASDGDHQLREERPARCLTILTAEDLPEGLTHSALGRTIVVEVKPGEINKEGLIERNRDRELLRVAMRGYLVWLADRIGSPEYQTQLQEAVEVEMRAMLAQLNLDDVKASERVATSLATLVIGMRQWVTYGMEARFIDKNTADLFVGRLQHALRRGAGIQVAEQHASRSPGVRWIESLEALVRGGRACLVKRNPGDESLSKAAVPSCPAIGWYDDSKVYLDYQIAWSTVRDALGGPDRFPHSKRQTFKELATRGVIVRGEDKRSQERFSQRITVAKMQVEVVVIPRAKLESVRFDPPEPPEVTTEELDEMMNRAN